MYRSNTFIFYNNVSASFHSYAFIVYEYEIDAKCALKKFEGQSKIIKDQTILITALSQWSPGMI